MLVLLTYPRLTVVRHGMTIRVQRIVRGHQNTVPVPRSATIFAEPIRLQSGYEECSDDIMWA